MLLDRDRAVRLAAAHPEQAAAVLAAADGALAHRFTFFGYPEQALTDPIDWHHDPLPATTWPDSWLARNPPGVGIAWRGAFEVGVRAISVAVALQGLRDAPALTPDRYRRVVRMLAESARRCWRERSRFSSANNRLVGELASLATVALLFPELAHAQVWEQRALAALSVEAQRQILPDGAGAKQAVSYQVFTADLILVVVALAAAPW